MTSLVPGPGSSAAGLLATVRAGSGETRELGCPVCLSATAHAHLVDYPAADGGRATLWQCHECHVAWIPGFEPPDYSSHSFVDYYVQVDAGLDYMLPPAFHAIECLQADGAHQHLSFLDVGGGFGFAADFARRCHGADSLLVEPGKYGRVGSQVLGHRLDEGYLTADRSPADAAGSTRWDVVYSSEVIEHVPDVDGFVGALAAAVAPDGIVVLTTPDVAYLADRVREGRPLVGTFLANVGMGQHCVLFSGQGLSTVLARHGLKSRVVEAPGGMRDRMVAFAGFDEALVSQAAERFQDPGHRADLLSQLERYLSMEPEQPSDDGLDGVRQSLRLGHRFRRLEMAINSGRLYEAAADSVVVDAISATLAELGTEIHLDGLIRFQRAQLTSMLGAPAEAAREYALAEESLMATITACGPLLTRKSSGVLPPLRIARGRCLIEAGRFDQALAVLDRVRTPEGRAEHYRLTLEEVEPGQLDEADMLAAVARLNQGAAAEAAAALDAVAARTGRKDLVAECTRLAAVARSRLTAC